VSNRNTDERHNIIPDIIKATSKNKEEAEAGMEFYKAKHLARLKENAHNFKKAETRHKQLTDNELEKMKTSSTMRDLTTDMAFLVRGFCDNKSKDTAVISLLAQKIEKEMSMLATCRSKSIDMNNLSSTLNLKQLQTQLADGDTDAMDKISNLIIGDVDMNKAEAIFQNIIELGSQLSDEVLKKC